MIPEVYQDYFYYDPNQTKFDPDLNTTVHVPLVEQQVGWLGNQNQKLIQQINLVTNQLQQEVNSQVANAVAHLSIEVERVRVERDFFQKQTEEQLKIWKEEWVLSMEDAIDLLHSFAQLRELLLENSPSEEFMECWKQDQPVTSLPQMVRDFIIEIGDK